MDLPFPEDINKWDWETVTSLSTEDESQHLEYKQTIHSPEDPEKSESVWKQKLEREITAFANASGGIIVFGVNNEGNPAPFERPEHELKQSVTRLIQNTRPTVTVDISDPIEPPSEKTDRVVLAVRVEEATRKPVLTSDSAIYWRINDRKEPMSLDQIEKLIVDRDRRQQAIRRLEMEIDRFYDLLEKEGSKKLTERAVEPPSYHLVNVESLKEALRTNTHLYADEDTREAITEVFRQIREIEDREIFYQQVIRGRVETFADGRDEFNEKQRQQLNKELERLKQKLIELAEETNLRVELTYE